MLRELRRNRRVGSLRRLDLAFLIGFSIASPNAAHAIDRVVAVHIHEVAALTNSDANNQQDMYRKISIEPVVGSGAAAHCDNEDDIDPDENHVTPSNWGCTMKVSGGPNTVVRIKIELWDDDDLDEDDELDLNPDHAQLGLDMRFEPRTSRITILGVPPYAAPVCAPGRISLSGFGGGGDEPAEITFSVASSGATAADGDSDGDGLFDTWEICGVNPDDDLEVELDLKAMGADPFRKDVFVEVDWMIDRTGVAPHSHEPWLPALIQAWAELDQAWLGNPPNDAGMPTRSGIALHVDVGTLFANYSLNLDDAGTPEYAIDASGNLDLVMDAGNENVTIAPGGVADIGNWGGGNEVPEVAVLQRPGPTANFFQPGSTFYAIKHGAGKFDSARNDVFHYALFAHTYAGATTEIGNAETATASDDFMVAMAPIMTNPNFDGSQRVDSDRDGEPDRIAEIFSPKSGLPIHGAIVDHKDTFIHELGHNFSLRHGPFNINGNPNYLSITNKIFFRGIPYDILGDDGAADSLGLDYDADGITDLRRYHYSHETLPAINEAALNENVPIDAPPPPSPIITSWTCPPGTRPLMKTGRADRPPDWDCDRVDGETGSAVDTHNVNDVSEDPSPLNEILLGHADYVKIKNGGLDFPPDLPSATLDEIHYIKANTQRILEPTGREWFQNRCPRPRRITFEEFAEGTRIDDEYEPLVQVLADALRAPTIVGPGGRNNVPTTSADRSLMNRPVADAPTPLSFTFDPPQRVVRLHVGQAGFTNVPSARANAVLRAFDEKDVPMGLLVHPLPAAAVGVVEQMTAVAVYPDELIRRVELSFETSLATGVSTIVVPLSEPVLIDDLSACDRLDETGLTPFLLTQPQFGDQDVALSIASEAVHRTTTVDPSGQPQVVRATFSGLPITVDGATAQTDLNLTRPEGTVVQVGAPATFAGWRFLYWRHSSGVSFGNGLANVPLTLLQDGSLTAVYEGRRRESGDVGREVDADVRRR
jgi:hypothetical protein